MAAKIHGLIVRSPLSATESGQRHNGRRGTMASLKPIARTVLDGVPRSFWWEIEHRQKLVLLGTALALTSKIALRYYIGSTSPT
jgi:hypothetical protein